MPLKRWLSVFVKQDHELASTGATSHRRHYLESYPVAS